MWAEHWLDPAGGGVYCPPPRECEVWRDDPCHPDLRPWALVGVGMGLAGRPTTRNTEHGATTSGAGADAASPMVREWRTIDTERWPGFVTPGASERLGWGNVATRSPTPAGVAINEGSTGTDAVPAADTSGFRTKVTCEGGAIGDFDDPVITAPGSDTRSPPSAPHRSTRRSQPTARLDAPGHHPVHLPAGDLSSRTRPTLSLSRDGGVRRSPTGATLQGDPLWAVRVTCRDGSRDRLGQARLPATERDAALAVPEADRALFAALRRWRNERAKRDGRPAYVLFRNAQLAVRRPRGRWCGGIPYVT